MQLIYEQRIAQLSAEEIAALFGSEIGALSTSATVAKEDKLALGAFSRVLFFSILTESDPDRSAPPVARFVVKGMRDSADVEHTKEQYGKHLLASEAAQANLPGFPTSYGVWGVTSEGMYRIASDEQLSQVILEHCYAEIVALEAALPERAIQLLTMLSRLGLNTIQTVAETTTHQNTFEGNLKMIYEKILRILSAIHGTAISVEKTPETYKESLQNVIVDQTRFDGIHGTPMGQNLPQVQVLKIRSMMSELCEKLGASFSNRLTHVHGDAWASNFFVEEGDDQTEPEVYGIDPATVGVSDPALDVAFALSDLVFLDVNNNFKVIQPGQDPFSGEHVELAEKMLIKYEQLRDDHDIRAILPLFVAFKCFVSATFDAHSEPQKQHALLAAAIGMLDEALSEGEKKFSFTRFGEYASSSFTNE